MQKKIKIRAGRQVEFAAQIGAVYNLAAPETTVDGAKAQAEADRLAFERAAQEQLQAELYGTLPHPEERQEQRRARQEADRARADFIADHFIFTRINA
jgi:hypothetical protein